MPSEIEINRVVDGLCFMDDDFFVVVFDGAIKELTVILRILLGQDDIEVRTVRTQYEIRNLEGRSVRLDALVQDADGREFNVEIQRDDSGALPKRARYHASMMDARLIRKGTTYKQLPESYVIFITENDIFHGGRSHYIIQRDILELNEVFYDEQHNIYVNAQIKDGSAISELMQDFKMTDYREIHDPELAGLMKQFKETEGGRKKMCEAVRQYGLRCAAEAREEAIQEGIQEGVGSTVCKLKEKGFSAEQIADLLDMSFVQVNAYIGQS